MASPEHPFNLRVSYTVIKHGFHHSFTKGIQAVKDEAVNAVSRLREIGAAEKPFPDLAYEIINGRLHWSEDELPVEYHYRAYISWLKDNGGNQAQIKHARLELANFFKVQSLALDLDDGLAAMWLSQKTTDPTKGVAYQQIRREGDKLIQSSQLLPFDQQLQIDSFRDQISEGREDVSIDDSVGGWIVTGEAVDFKQELPEMIEAVMMPSVVSEAMPLSMPVSLAEVVPTITMPAAIPIFEAAVSSVPPTKMDEIVIPVNEATGFWWQVSTKENVDYVQDDIFLERETTIVRSVEVVNATETVSESVLNKPARSNTLLDVAVPISEAMGFWFEVMAATATPVSAETSTVIETPAPEFVAENTSDLEHEEIVATEISIVREPTRRVFVGPKIVEPVITVTKEKETPVLVASKSNDQPIRNVFAGEKKDKPNAAVVKLSKTKPEAVKVEKGVGTVLRLHRDTVREKDKPNTVVSKPSGRVPEGDFQASEPPVFEIDESVIVPHFFAAVPDYTIYILAFFFALLNTNMVQLESGRGSGMAPLEAGKS